jgi:hypothetical protein
LSTRSSFCLRMRRSSASASCLPAHPSPGFAPRKRARFAGGRDRTVRLPFLVIGGAVILARDFLACHECRGATTNAVND